MWQQWVNLVLGLWILATPFLGLSGDSLTWSLAITGIVVAGLALWGGLQEQDPEYHRHTLQAMQH